MQDFSDEDLIKDNSSSFDRILDDTQGINASIINDFDSKVQLYKEKCETTF